MGIDAAYRGERSAASMLQYFRQRAVLDRDEQGLADLLIDVETAVAEALLPLVDRYGLPHRLETDEEERAKTRASTYDGWTDLVAFLDDRLDVYVAEFEALRSAAPPEDHAALDLLVEHEKALICFGNCIRAGNAAGARGVLLPLAALRRR